MNFEKGVGGLTSDGNVMPDFQGLLDTEVIAAVLFGKEPERPRAACGPSRIFIPSSRIERTKNNREGRLVKTSILQSQRRYQILFCLSYPI